MLVCMVERHAEYMDDGYRVYLKWLNEDKKCLLKDLTNIDDNIYIYSHLNLYTTNGTHLARIFVKNFKNDWSPKRGEIDLKWINEPKDKKDKNKKDFILHLVNGGFSK